ncbi:deoxyribonucleoside regulator [Moorella thermoacetica]|uniref:Deoxyribonucleoside regulator n=1 Tax=Neomoorella thermoacetica TaxID=1525 RepID=A0A1J5JH43_NEOTH|nr:deoxyribonucleoside regulator [Moorella thermoacetica]
MALKKISPLIVTFSQSAYRVTISLSGDSDDIHLMTKICYLYYNKDLTQSQIASQLDITRQMVSRLLQKAKQEGLVQIQIRSPAISVTELEYKLEKKYGLKEAIVLKNDYLSSENLKDNLGLAAAEYLEQQLAPGLKIGVGWGTTLRAFAEYFDKYNRTTYNDIKVIQLMGGINRAAPNSLAQDIVRLLASSTGGKEFYLHAPCIVENREVRDAIISEAIIKEVIEQYWDLDLAVIGIGNIEENSFVVKSGNVELDEIYRLRNLGAVGEICLHYYDIQGRFLQSPLMDRVITISIEQLRHAKKIIAVCGGRDKYEAILGILRSGLLTCLITDEDVARYVTEGV